MTYIPGVCNITKRGARKRFYTFLIFAAASFLYYVVTLPQYRIILAFPIFVAAISLLEYVFSFCVYFGLRGRHEDEKGMHYTNERYRNADRRKSYKMLAAAVIIALLILVLLI